MMVEDGYVKRAPADVGVCLQGAEEGGASGEEEEHEVVLTTHSENDEKVSAEDFEILKVLGQGSFGKVSLPHLPSPSLPSPLPSLLPSLMPPSRTLAVLCAKGVLDARG